MAATIYLHWTATGYDWIRPGHYHVIIGGDGRVHRLHATSVDLPAHTWARNSNAVALSCACMGGQPDPWTLPPTPAQLESLCAETAAIATSWGWSAEDITIQRVMTHAEARGEALAVAIDSEGRSWALAATLLERYRIPHAWDANQRRILIGSLDVAPTYRDDSVQASVGWPLFTMTLQTGNAPVILTGIVRPSDAGDRAWCRVLEFAEEFGISVRYDPFTLLKRRGG
jgi:hypothetical protein